MTGFTTPSSTTSATARSGPLSSIRVVEINALGPAPFCAMMLADLGADIVRIVRPGPPSAIEQFGASILLRGRPAVTADLKIAKDRDAVLALIALADVLIEGYRPGVMERLGLGPDVCLQRNPKLVYGRMTGWGQTGPLSARAGHDINYTALSGALHAIGTAESGPVIPLNLIADYGGGAMFLAVGVLAALTEARQSGRGQIVDAAMVEGASLLMSMVQAAAQQGQWHFTRASNLLDGAAPFYRCYRTADDRHMAVGAIEPQFFAALLQGLDLAPAQYDQNDRTQWPAMAERFAAVFATRTQAEWTDHFAATDACVSPVLSAAESPLQPQARARNAFQDQDGTLHPTPSPRFSQTPGAIRPASQASLNDIAARWTSNAPR